MNAFILYDTLATGIRAKVLLDRAVHHLDVPQAPSLRIWKSQMLGDDEHLQAASREAAESSIVVLSLQSDGDLPERVRRWMDHWLQQRENAACMLLAILETRGRRQASSLPAHAFLQRAAAASGVRLFLHIHDLDTAGSATASET